MLYTQVSLATMVAREIGRCLLYQLRLAIRHMFTQLQETCLYPRLNAALRNHDMRSLEPFLPYMKLLLSGLYQLPLMHVRTYRGVKLEIFEASESKCHLHCSRKIAQLCTPHARWQIYNLLIGQVWSWWSFSSTTKHKHVLNVSDCRLELQSYAVDLAVYVVEGLASACTLSMLVPVIVFPHRVPSTPSTLHAL